MSAAHRTATVWGGAGVLAGALGSLLLALPFYPDDSADGWAVLGWAIVAVALAAVLALLGGAVALQQGLRRGGFPHAGRTALAFVPAALLLGVPTAGLGALAAPAAAVWLVDGFTGQRVGWGPVRPGGLLQRLVLAVIGSALLGTWALNEAGYELGGRVDGALLTWLAVLPALVVPPVLLLRRVVRRPWLAGGIAVAAGLLALAVPGAVRDVHPTPERLEQIVTELPVPAGQQVQAVRTQVFSDGSWDIPVTALSTGGQLPPFGTLMPTDGSGLQAAQQWEQVLRDQGWEQSTLPPEHQRYWLPDDVQRTLAGHAQYELGPWLRATAVPYGDGALLVLSTRP